MNLEKSQYVCPETKSPLYIVRNDSTHEINKLETGDGISYSVKGGIPDLTFPKELNIIDQKTKDFYDYRVEAYDKYLYLTFKTHNENEQSVRNSFIDLLEIKSGDRVLDIACGTGRDSEIIAQRLDEKGQLFMQDIAPLMLERCFERLENFKLKKEFCISNAAYLPFPDKYFNAVYSFGGLGEFSEIKRSLAEMVRVAKVGGKVVVGDESIPPWLRNTEFAKILIKTNPQFQAKLPLEELPIEAREVCLRWVIGGVFYLIEFRVGVGEPEGNFDFDIPGPRGGTYRTRYEGELEGVTKEAKELAYKAIREKDISMHKWLDEIVKKAALGVLNSD
jgi:ubiquinone/menaquinone biosynthesis C-methylase UbiE